MTTIGTVLVTAATGKTGRRVARRLAAAGADVRAGSRGGDVRFDWEDESTWEPALRGADAAYVNYFPDLASPAAPPALRTFGRLAAGTGVGRLVLLSGRGEPEAVVAEGALRESAVDLTVVRAAFFAQNFSEGLLHEGVLAGEFAFPAGATAEPFVDADDLAEVVVAALTEPGHGGAVHELTGPRPVTFAEAAREIGRATGREVRYVPVEAGEYARMLEGYGLPAPEARWLADLFAGLLDGHNASVTDDVERILGRAPRDFTEWAKETAASGTWDA
ncbi:NmrA family transcriptional regulator [Streptomyces sp. NPDC015127]|uniref:NmrA family transcriptional regulator n=1 Tax=Streptomyces sp. NPDC015127 TaxID=3364939 RepID=UPI0036F83EC1